MKISSNSSASVYGELPSLLFEMRQIIRQTLPGAKQSDPNEWMRLQTMQFVADQEKPTMHDVAEYLRIKAPSATSLIQYLVSHGLIAREAGDDRRVVRLTLTPQGEAVLKGYGTESEKMMRNAFSKLQEKEVCTLRDLLQKMIRGNAA